MKRESEPEHEIRNSIRHSGVWNEANKINTPPAAPNAEKFSKQNTMAANNDDYDGDEKKSDKEKHNAEKIATRSRQYGEEISHW